MAGEVSFEYPSGIIPSFKEIIEQRPDILSFRDLVKQEVYAVIRYRYVYLSGERAQVMVATLWSPQFTWSRDNTQEVWCVKVLKDLLIGDAKRVLPFWIAVSNEKKATCSQGSYYPVKAMDFTERQLSYFDWAGDARKLATDTRQVDIGRDDDVSVYSANTQVVRDSGFEDWRQPPSTPSTVRVIGGVGCLSTATSSGSPLSKRPRI
jgi:hypothetical protein